MSFNCREYCWDCKEYNAVIALEDLKRIRDRVNGNNRSSWKIYLGANRRIQNYIHYKALLEGAPVVYVSPRGTSKTSPKGGRLISINYRQVKLPNGIITTRDVVASWNLALRYLQMRGSRGWLSPDSLLNDGMKTRPNRGSPFRFSKFRKYPKYYTRATTEIGVFNQFP